MPRRGARNGRSDSLRTAPERLDAPRRGRLQAARAAGGGSLSAAAPPPCGPALQPSTSPVSAVLAAAWCRVLTHAAALPLLLCLAGISRDSLHKRRATGGKQKAWRKKRK